MTPLVATGQDGEIDALHARIDALETEIVQLRCQLAISERALSQSEKLKALQQLTCSVAHELANPLTAMIARAVLIGTVRSIEEAARHAGIIEEQGKRATKIVRNLSAFARRRAVTRALFSLNDVVRAVVDVHSYQLRGTNIEIVEDLETEPGRVEGDPHEVEQVLLNLVANAQYAMIQAHGRGRLTFRTRSNPTGVRLAVEDDGPGIELDIQERMFEPFFTTKGEDGTGLGLSIARDLMAAHGGRLWVDSAPQAGTRMWIELPRVPAPAVGAVLRPPMADVRTDVPRGRVLIVDDDVEVGLLMADLLRSRGYETEYVRAGEEALARLRSCRYDGLLTDLRMPDMGGDELWRTLAREQPALASRTIFMTGYYAAPETTALLDAIGRPYLQKPFRSDELDEVLAVLAPAAE
jgi:nitrogen-specific signal transduction histidine kinase/ActR/RegA family two-component response regulator